MDFAYGHSSRQRLVTCEDRIQLVFRKALELGLIDISIIDGHRGEAAQKRYFELGKSKTPWPESKHNCLPSRGIDAAPFISGKPSSDYNHCSFLAGVVLAVAKYEGVRMRWGGNWDMDGEPLTDQTFQDLWHYELIGG